MPTMLKKIFKENPDFYILLINIVAVFTILWTENIPLKFAFLLIGMFLTLCTLAFLTLWKKIGLFNFFRNLQISILCFVVLIFLAQTLYALSPAIYPRFITNLIETRSQREMKGKVVEFLDHSPFAKPKPNVLIHVPGDYGNSSEFDFEYEWVTDQRGYKNSPEIAIKDQFDVIALGDSFTEGMGVKTQETWVSQLNRVGIRAYSLGVQGYAPSQMSGTFKQFGSPLNPKLVIIGYLGGIYDREALLMKDDATIVREKTLPSAIGRLVKNDLGNGREFRQQFKFISSAALFVIADGLLRLYRSHFDPLYSNDPRFILDKLMVADEVISIGPMQRYKQEMQDALRKTSSREKLESRPEWQKTLVSFKEIATIAKQQGAKTLLVMFYNRGPIYLNKATGKNLEANYADYVERNLLREFTLANGLLFLDTEATLKDSLKEIGETTNISQYPYLKYDGHLSKKGNEIVANLVADYIKTNQLLR